MKARDLMTPLPGTVVPADSIVSAARTMRTRDVGLLPVIDDASTMRLVGVITDRDIVMRCIAEGHTVSECTVGDHMTCTPLQTAEPGDAMSDVLDKMETACVRRIPVVERGDRVVGVVAQADVAIKIGPDHPRVVEELLASVSAPAQHA